LDLARLSWPEAAQRAGAVAVVPLGSLEQHGPHLPLDTDATIATAVAARATRNANDAGTSAVLLPTLPYGASGEHAGFTGTVSIGTEALTAVLIELGRSLTGPCSAVVFASGHGGNADALAAATSLLGAEGRSVRTWTPAVPGGDAHAGHTETSIMLALEPGLVHHYGDVVGDARPLTDLIDELRSAGVEAVSTTGVLGDPSGSTAAEGREILDGLVADLTTVIVEATGPGREAATATGMVD
jgi:creatinine amidohydrolase